MHIKVTSFQESEYEIRFIRDTVFGVEQGVVRELDWDGNDPLCIHVVAFDNAENPIGTGRVQPDGKIGRLAALKNWRQRGIGSQMLEALVEAARTQGLAQVHLHAQVHAVNFYEKRRFTPVGEEFMEVGIPHVNMIRKVGRIVD
jgi:predicted GNAT family N-acyltransferase